jgi:hypothetical protein
MGVDRPGHHPVLAPVLEQRPRIDIRLVGIVRPNLEEALFVQVALLCFLQLRLHELDREIRRGGNQHQAGDAFALAALAQFLDHPERDPRAHGRADENLPAGAEPAEHRQALAQPFRDRAVGEVAAGFAVPGIIVAQEGATTGRRPFVERLGFGAQHVGAEAAEPDHTGFAAGQTPDGNRRAAHLLEIRTACRHMMLLRCKPCGTARFSRKDRITPSTRQSTRPFGFW